ncbi:Y4yA family PLP-dependent enzyme [Psychrobacter pygoscelis]|uniref:Y4yA family PLP-dependent enzyme n=1 Tax=Psychrobacter pygoscelis TaxID=2488563 RepID=UPI00103F4728|nr:Y4yA family PLP-dependent enzyme [Psychrobacter pygoscelis]
MQTSYVTSKSGSFTPILNEFWKSLVEQKADRIFQYINSYGSPIHLINLESFRKNISELEEALVEENVEFKIFYGSKVNKSIALIRESYLVGSGIDVSSIYEYKDAVSAGFNGTNIIATGPVKPIDFLLQLIKSKSLISIDSLNEYYDLKKLLKNRSLKNHPILIRFKPDFEKNSRFGITAHTIKKMLVDISISKEILFLGFHFHLSGYNIEPRVEAIQQLLKLIEAANKIGINTSVIDMGGGMPIKYVNNSKYKRIIKNISESHFINNKKPLDYYPYGGFLTAPDWLRGVLNSNLTKDLKVKEWFRANNLTLYLEPGRALVNQACMTVFEVSRVKPISENNHVIFVRGSSFNACETWFNSEFLIDPILISKRKSSCKNENFFAYIAGHSCLAEDVITHRILKFPLIPQAGDLIIFANTGGYQMDLLENEFHRHPMPARLVINKDFSSAFVDI